ncbi:hypothetical protein G4B88_030926 [Cannabis sativa]|uniref:Uncharacterized protein n=1 Tax=Cannabis sativa TaxID=3483 RepID=A0A7J6EAM4_CANSA|nr:hypothetical protein G4B88_030926 [Cannabis sativa]
MAFKKGKEPDESRISPMKKEVVENYDRLPSQLKHCFAFCRLFPKDYEIGVEEVINLWIAQGFIKSSSENQNDLEDVGYAHFMHLVWGSFFEPPFKSDDDDVVKFKIHDAMHDLAILMAGTTGVVIDGPKAKVFDDRTRHVSLTFSSIELWKIPMDSLKQNRKLRTFLSSNQKHDDFIQRLYSMGFSKLPNTIGGLKHLRYLNLSSNPFVSLPNSITTLHSLHTLNLEYCEKLWRLPQEIDKLLNLKHLLLKGCLSLVFMPSGLGRLTSLRRLGEFNQCSYRSKNIARLEELGNLNSLRGSLRINLKHGKHDSLECSAAHLNKKQHLQHIILSWEVEGDDDITGEMIESDELSLDALQPHQNLKILTIHQCTGIRLAHWLSLLTNLVYLSLDACIKCQQLPELDQLPSLQELHLSELGSLEYISPKFSASSLFFPSLTSLSIFHCPKLKGWWRDSANLNQAQGHFVLPSFSCLSVLNIYDCLFAMEEGAILSAAPTIIRT